MKAITIWQPWASLIACGAKKYETRSWPTKYRGPIAIHAAAKDPRTLPREVREALGRYAGYRDDRKRSPRSHGSGCVYSLDPRDRKLGRERLVRRNSVRLLPLPL